MKNKLVLWLAMMLMCFSALAQSYENMLPVPQHMQVQGGSFQLGKVKLATPVLQAEWENFIAQAGGEVSDKASRLIEIKLVSEVQGAKLNQEEAYRLKVTSKGIEVEATTQKGVYWALQTLRQLEQKKGSYKACEIIDWPAFKIRGFMHDIGRSYLSIDELKKEIEILSRYKINVFHWHLTENQAWRFQVNSETIALSMTG